MAQDVSPVPNTPLLPDPTRDVIWKRWFAQLYNRVATSSQIYHNSLAGLQGGTTDQYYHLTSSQHAIVTSFESAQPNRVVYVNTNGAITATAGLRFLDATSTLGVSNISTNALNISTIAALRVLFVSTTGFVQGSANLTYSAATSTLSAQNVTVAGQTSTASLSAQNVTVAGQTSTASLTVTSIATSRVLFTSTAGLVSASANMTYSAETSTLTLQNVTTLGNTRLGDADTDVFSVAGSTVTWSGDPHHSGRHLFTSTVGVSTLLYTSGSFFIGTSSSIFAGGVDNRFQYHATDGTGGFAMFRWQNNAGGTNFLGYKSRGTTVGASFTAVQDGDSLFSMSGIGTTGTASSYFTGAIIRTLVDGTVSASSVPGAISFETSPVNTSSVIRAFYVGSDQVASAAMGGSSTLSAVLMKADIDTTAVGNVGTGEDDLITYSLPAESLNATGRGIRATAWGRFSASSGGPTRSLRCYFGTAMVVSTQRATDNYIAWRAVTEVFSTGSNTQACVGKIEYYVSSLGSSLTTVNVSTATQQTSSAITIKCTGQTTAATNNHIVQDGQLVEFLN